MDSHRKFWKSFRHAFRGFGHALESEHNFRIHLVAALAVIGAIIFFKFSPLESALLIGVTVLVLSLELMNTALEKTLDMLEPNHHPLVGKIKDMAAASVLVAALGALVVAVFVVSNHFNF
jgi:diacylglycerol kinase